MQRNFTPEQDKIILAEYESGSSTYDLVRKWGGTRTSVRHAIIRAGGSMRTHKDATPLKKLTSEQVTAMIADLTAGMFVFEAVKKYEVTCSTVLHHAKQHGVVVKKARLRLRGTEQATEAASRYDKGEASLDLCREYGVSIGSLLQYVRDGGYEVRSGSEARRIYSVNEAAFDQLPGTETWTEEQSYWIGFLLADGCVMRNGNHWSICLSLQAADKMHVEMFRDFIGAENPVKVYTNYINYRGERRGYQRATLTVRSDRLATSLMSFGVVPRKSTRERMDCRLVSNRHAWRGAVDGDGWVGIQKCDGRPIIGLVGSRRLCRQFATFVLPHIPYVPNVYRSGNNNWGFKLTGQKAVDIIRLLYDGASVALDRKMIAAKHVLATWKGPIGKTPQTKPHRRKRK